MKPCRYPAFLLIFLLITGGTVGADQALFQKALKSDQAGFFEDAVKNWKIFLDSKPAEGPRIFAGIKLSLVYFKILNYQEALETARGLANAYPDSFHANFNSGAILSSMGKLGEALKSYEKAVKLNPDEGLGYVGLALCLFGSGNSETAIVRLKEVKDIFKRKKNIAWHRDARYMIHQMKNFEKYPPDFSNLWLSNNLKMVRETYEKKILRQLGKKLVF